MTATSRGDAPDEDVVDSAVAALQDGGAIVVPTDTVYGVAALPTVSGATAQLFALKGRSEQQPFAVLVSDLNQALELMALDPTRHALVARWAETFWPGPLTIVARRSEAAAAFELGGGPTATIGVRCPANAIVRAIAARVGPIATTSANRSGESTPVTARDAAAALAGPVGLVIDGGPAGTVASTVVDISVDPWLVLRVGAVTEAALR